MAFSPNDRSQPRPIGFVTGVWNPEDLVALPGTPWIIISGMRSRRRHGALFAMRRDGLEPAVELTWTERAERGRLSRDLFDPHGIAARVRDDGVFELLVIDHGGGEAVDRLIIDAGGEYPLVRDGERILQPPGTSGNALAPMPDCGFVLTSMFDPTDPEFLSKFARGAVTGGVWRWGPIEKWHRFGSLGLSGANGIAVTDDGSAVYVSEWSARRVWRLGPDGAPEAVVATRFLPDNLRWTGDGGLLLAGQDARPEAVFGCEQRGETPPLAFEVAWLDPVSMTLSSFVRIDEGGADAIGFGGATGALRVQDHVWVGSFTGERIATFPIEDSQVPRSA